MARKGRMCVVQECGRRAASGSVVCTEHRDSALGEQTEREIATMTRRMSALAKLEGEEEKREAFRVFRRQVLRGDYAAVFSSKMLTMLDSAGREVDLKMMIGAMKAGAMRVLLEEEQPSRAAHALAKLSFAMSRAMVLQAEWSSSESVDGSLAKLLNEILIDLESEDDQKQRLVDEGVATIPMIAQMDELGIKVGTWAAEAWIAEYKKKEAEGDGVDAEVSVTGMGGPVVEAVGRVVMDDGEVTEYKPVEWPPRVHPEYAEYYEGLEEKGPRRGTGS